MDVGHRQLVNRDKPDESLLLTYMLPRADTRYPHPDVPNFKPLYQRAGAPGYEDVGHLARALVRAAPERMLWASNWPHPSATAGKRPDDADLLDLLLDWAPEEATRRMILVDNPARLYGF